MRVCVVGCGFVGASSLEAFAKKNEVLAYDISPNRVATLRASGYSATSVTEETAGCDAYLISVPTPLVNEHEMEAECDMSYVTAAVDSVLKVSSADSIVVIESSVVPGTTRRMLGDRPGGRLCGFSSERIDPGRVSPPPHDIPKLIAGVDTESAAAITALYATAYTNVVPVRTVETAEMAKLYENTFRLINIAFANEIAQLAARFGVDAHEMVDACSTKPFGFMPFRPGLGAGGTCIPVNPAFLLQAGDAPLLRVARNLNFARPLALADYALKTLNADSRVLVMGAGFKPGQAITYMSPSIRFAQRLASNGIAVDVCDPVVAAAGVTLPAGLQLLPAITAKAAARAKYDRIFLAVRQQNWESFDKLKNVERL